MTENQLRYEANQISQQQANELQRHNLESEGIEYTKNSLTKEYQDRWYAIESRKLDLDAERLELEKEYKVAQGERKLNIEDRLADIQQQRADIDDELKDLEGAKQLWQSTLGFEQQDEVERHNAKMEEIQKQLASYREQEVNWKQTYESTLAYLESARTELDLLTGRQKIRKAKFEADVAPIVQGIESATQILSAAGTFLRGGASAGAVLKSVPSKNSKR